MADRPILFSAPMVRAILAGTKTQTRRAHAPRGLGFIGCCCGGSAARWVADGDRWHCATCGGGARLTATDVEYLRCPYGQPGDRLWVREAWARTQIAQDATGSGMVVYREGDNRTDYGGPWKPGIHMPRAASRITLEVTGVRVERLQDISEDDAQAEGVVRTQDGGWGLPAGEHYHCDDPRHSYLSLWEAINGAGSVEANPWVWAVEFRRAEEPTHG